MKSLSRLMVLFFLVLAETLSASFILAEEVPEVFINEIAWMGGESSYTDEWIELYSDASSSINLDGWALKANDGTPDIILTGTIQAQGFYLLERTDDDAVPDIAADQFYTGALGNNGERLELFNGLGVLVDSVNCESGWFAGDNSTKQTMERKDHQIWQTSKDPGGTPKNKNSVLAQIIIEGSVAEPEIEEVEIETEIPLETEELKIVYPSNILINEILPSPTGPDSEGEWIEILNRNSFDISLFNWQITDVTGKTASYIFPKGTTVSPNGFFVLWRPVSKITLNNSGDGLKLIQPDGNIIDAVDYEKAKQGESFSRIGSRWVWSDTLTPGELNIVQVSESKKEAPENEVTDPVPYKKELAAVGEQVSRAGPTPSFVLLIAIPIAVFSGIIILTLKKKLKIDYSNKN